MTEEVRFPDKDRPLRRDVSELGALLGRVLEEQGGERLFGGVESARRAARARRRRRGERSGEILDQVLCGLDAEDALAMVQAFSSFFELVNLAERLHRVRRRRDYRLAGEAQPAGLEAVMSALRASGVSADDLAAIAGDLVIEPVFTAHPTEAARRAILDHQRRIGELLEQRLRGSVMTPEERQEWLAQVHEAVSIAWQTEENRATRPTVADEVEHVLWYVVEVLYDVVPDFEEALDAVVQETTGRRLERAVPVLQCASWVGGDMDGNPNVGPQTMRATLARHRELVLHRYRREVLEIAERLTQSRSKVRILPALEERIEHYRALFPAVVETMRENRFGMAYQLFLRLVGARLERSVDAGAEGAYGSAAELIFDLDLVRRSLDEHQGAGVRRLERLKSRVRCFGFHLATLDVRQDALVHRRVVGELLGDMQFADDAAATRLAKLEAAARVQAALPESLSDEAARVVEVMVAIGELRRQHGASAVGPHVISMAKGPDDALALLEIARRSGLVESDGTIPLDVAPLFETVDDLAAARATLEALLSHSGYRRHLERRGRRQVVMLGYSDSNKDAGLVAARWALQRAQEELAAAAAAHDITLVLFHGRGGTVSRGGGKPREAILAQPRSSIGERLRFTEQGEIIRAKYGLHAIAQRTLERIAGALIEARACPAEGHDPAEAAAVMELLATESRKAYRGLVVDDPQFFEFFRNATPIDVIERLRIGSRPTSRRAQKGIEDLRAIPWVFSWTQSRHVLTGWFGMGQALEVAQSRFDIDLLRRLAATWPFFGTLLADVEMVLAKADMAISRRYAALAGPSGEPIQAAIEAEYDRTVALVCAVRDQQELLAHEPVLQRAIRLRNPYVDPMSLLQVDLLARWRAGERADAELERALITSVKGIARGLQNTG